MKWKCILLIWFVGLKRFVSSDEEILKYLYVLIEIFDIGINYVVII